MVIQMEGRGRETEGEKEERKKERESDADKMDDNERIYMLTTHKISNKRQKRWKDELIGALYKMGWT